MTTLDRTTDMDDARSAFKPEPLLDVRSLTKRFGRSTVPAVDAVSFSIDRGEAFGLIGESGSGKTTIARCIVGLTQADSGTVRFQGRQIDDLGNTPSRSVRRNLQMLFQDPYSSLDSRMTIGQLIEEPLRIHGVRNQRERAAAVVEILELVGIDPAFRSRTPHGFSGGQRQRIALARALVLRPSFVILDEPVSALDVSVQAQIVNLLKRLQRELSLTCLVVLHDLAVARHLCDRVAVLRQGTLVELGTPDVVFANPAHSYTRSLIAAIPGLHAELPPDHFIDDDALREVTPGHWAAVTPRASTR